MTLTQALQHATSVGLARIDAQVLLLHVMGQAPHARAWLLTHDQQGLSTEQHAAFEQAVERRLQGEPVAYITGEKEFFGLRLQVDARVLDPRADTETLVEWALDVWPDALQTRALDLGTGSGAIALALQQARPQAYVWAVDASADALSVARANAQALNLPVLFVQSHWLQAVDGMFDVIVSNPPYIAEHDPHLPSLVHEPAHALVSGADGLDDIRHIVAHAMPHLKPGGWLLLEHGHDQADAVQSLLAQAGFAQVQSRNDLAGIRRCSGGQRPAVE